MKPIAIYALIAVLMVPVYPHFVSPNEFSRWVAAAALVEDGSLEVSRQAALLGPRFEDLSVVDGRVYSNKPPGLAMVSLPGYIAARAIVGERPIRAAIYAMRIVGSTIPLLLLAVTMIAVSRRMKVAVPFEPAVFTLLFATPLFAYGLLLFSHALVAACLFGAWALLFPLHTGARSDVLAGALMGLAVLSELPSAVAVGVLLFCVVDRRGLGRLIAIVAGGLPFAVLLGAYNTAAFGGPLQLSYLYEKLDSYRAAAREGIGLPSPIRIVRILADPSKGLFLFSPVLIVAISRMRAVRPFLSNRAFIALSLVPVSLVLFAAGYVNWHGGWTVGPRYIMGAVPFLLVPLLVTPSTRVLSFLIGFSAATVALTSVVFPFVPEDFVLPWGTLGLPFLWQGLGAPNLLHLAGFSRVAPVVPLIVIVAALILSVERPLRMVAAGGAVVAVALGITFATTVGQRADLRLQRGYIAEVYFGQRGSLATSVNGSENVPPGLFRRRDYELSLPPPEWPFTD